MPSLANSMASRTKRRDYGVDVPATNSEQVFQIEIGRLKPNPYQPRKEFDAEELSALADSMREHGLLQPIVIYQDDEDGEIYIAAGERRKRAAEEFLNWETISAINMGKRSAEWARITALLENLGRADLNPYERISGITELVRTSGLSNKEIAARIGIGVSQLSKYLTVAKYPDLIKELMLGGKDASFTAVYNKAKKLQADEEHRGRRPQPISSKPARLTAEEGSAVQDSHINDDGDRANNEPRPRYEAEPQHGVARSSQSQLDALQHNGNRRGQKLPVSSATDTIPFRAEYISVTELAEILAELTSGVLGSVEHGAPPYDVEELFRQYDELGMALKSRFGST